MKTLLLLSGFFIPMLLNAQFKKDSIAIVDLLIKDYATLETYDFEAHLPNVTADYALIENGELWDIKREKEYYLANAHRKLKRVNDFDIHAVRVYSDVAYTIYTLQSEITENGAMRGRRWMESAIFRKEKDGWKIELLHSTRIDLRE